MSQALFDPAYEELLGHRVELERELGRRSFLDFYKMAWPMMDPEPYQHGNHISVIAYNLQRAARREIRELLVCIPPRHSKSLLCSVAFPAWIWTWWPECKFITCSFDIKLASQHSLATRRLIESPWYRERWPHVRLYPDQNQKMWYQNTRGGQRFVGSPSSGVTGHGSDINLFDDPHNVATAESEARREKARVLLFESMISRFNNPARGVTIVVQQRVHQNDVAGECIRRGYFHVVLPAKFEPDHPQLCPQDWRTRPGQPLWPRKFPASVLDRLFAILKPYAAAGQQQQRPVAREGGLFKLEWFQIVDALPANLVWIRAWDLAGTRKTMKNDPDWTAGVKMGIHPTTGEIFIAHVIRFQEDPGGVEKGIAAIAAMDGKKCPIFMPQDPAQAGKAQVAHYTTKVLQGYPLRWATVAGDGSKADRADPFAAQAAVGNVKLLRGIWNEDFLLELTMFPSGGHDDQVDAAASAYGQLLQNNIGLLDFMRQQRAAAESEKQAAKEAREQQAAFTFSHPNRV